MLVSRDLAETVRRKRFFLRDSKVLLFSVSTFFPPGNYLFRPPAPAAAAAAAAAISACHRTWISLRYFGHAVATAFLLSTTSLGGLLLASSTPSAFPLWDESTLLQRKQQHHLYNTKVGLIPTFFAGVSRFDTAGTAGTRSILGGYRQYWQHSGVLCTANIYWQYYGQHFVWPLVLSHCEYSQH